MKFKVWCDSGANSKSKRVEIVDLSDIGLTESEWLEMSDSEKDEAMKEVAFAQLDWGFLEVEK